MKRREKFRIGELGLIPIRSLASINCRFLLSQMAMANMTESLRNLWSETVSAAKGSSQSVSVAALLAASVGGIQDANMIESLKEAGLYPLAFLYASVWGAGGPANRVESVETAWKQALA